MTMALPLLRRPAAQSLKRFAVASNLKRCVSTRGLLYYQSDKVPRSVRSTGLVGTNRDLLGSDGEFFGVDPVPVEVEIHDGREKGFTLDSNGFCLHRHDWRHVNYYDNDAVVQTYYSECEALVRSVSGASKVVAFDHNLRAKERKQAGDSLEGGNAVQEPLITYGVHNDYTMTSAPQRVRQLSRPPNKNDTRQCPPGESLIPPTDVEALLQGRYVFINVWRNITDRPVERFPLAACDAQSVSVDDLVVFEIRYADRVGENYFVGQSGNSAKHRWYYFPRMTKDEVMLLKCWDSRGRDFSEGAASSAPATFSLHSAFDDFATLPSAPDRESIEVRTVAFFDS